MYDCSVCDVDFRLKLDLIRHFKTNKHNVNFNEQQQVLIKKLLEYLKSDSVNGEDGIRINSAGGTGKSFVVSTHTKYNEKVIALGPTHQAVSILNKMFYGKAMTFHKYFGWSLEINKDNKEFSIWKIPKIPDGTVFIIDEISMMTRAHFSLFKHFIYGKYKYILMGDKYQLPPYENKIDDILPLDVKLIENKDKNLSLFFQFKCNEVQLIKNMRAKNLDLELYVSEIREKVKLDKPVVLQNNWKLDYSLLRQNINREYIFIALKKEDVLRLNLEIRNYLSPDAGEIAIGDKIRLTKYTLAFDKNTNKKINLVNGERYTITYFEKQTKKLRYTFDDKEELSIDVWYIQLNDNLCIYKICDSSILKFKSYKLLNERLITKLKNTNINLPNKANSKEKISLDSWKIILFKELRNKYSFLTTFDFGFASTVNKAQGASYDMVFIYNKKNFYFGNKHKYTACSRVINDLKIFN